MVLITKNPRLLGLVRRGYARARVREDEVLIVWNARVHLHPTLVIMESSCPIYLDKVIEQLRRFTGEEASPPGRLVWVRARGNRDGRWAFTPARAEGRPR